MSRRLWVVGGRRKRLELVLKEAEIGSSEARGLWKGFEDGRRERRGLGRRREDRRSAAEGKEGKRPSRFGEGWEVVDGFLQRR